MDMKEQLIDILADQLGVEKGKITVDSKLVDDLGADSLDTVEINQVIEEKFNVNIPDTDIAKIKTVKDIIDYLGPKINK